MHCQNTHECSFLEFQSLKFQFCRNTFNSFSLFIFPWARGKRRSNDSQLVQLLAFFFDFWWAERLISHPIVMKQASPSAKLIRGGKCVCQPNMCKTQQEVNESQVTGHESLFLPVRPCNEWDLINCFKALT